MSLLQRMKMLQTQDDAPQPLSKGARRDDSAASQEFAIKAMPAVAWEDRRSSADAVAPSGRSMIQINAWAGPAGYRLQQSSPQQSDEHQEDVLEDHTLLASLSTPNSRRQRSASDGPQMRWQGPPGMQPLRLYHSISQFGATQELYRSSQSVVMKTTCLATQQEVILKRYLKKKLSCRAVHKMQREVQLMHQLRGHAGVAQILGDFQCDRYFCIVMELCRGGDLYKRAMVAKGDKPLSQQWICTKVIAPLLRTLSVLHDQFGIVHRDIKPENIFLTADDELLLGDFGLAIQQQRELPFLKAGTLDYMAPEVVQNPLVESIDECPEYAAQDLRRMGFEPYDEKVDVWAVGVLAYELMMQGDTPFYHDEPAETEKLIMQCDLVGVNFPRQHLLSPWADFVRTTLQADPARRPTAAQLLRHRWVQLHLQARHRPPLAPERSASMVAALERSSSMPPLSLARDCQAAAALAQQAAAVPLKRAPAASMAAFVPAGSIPAGPSATTTASSEGLQLLADAAEAAAGVRQMTADGGKGAEAGEEEDTEMVDASTGVPAQLPAACPPSLLDERTPPPSRAPTKPRRSLRASVTCLPPEPAAGAEAGLQRTLSWLDSQAASSLPPGRTRMPSRLGMGAFTAAESPAAGATLQHGQQLAGGSGSWRAPGAPRPSAALAAAPLNWRRMGRTGSVMRPAFATNGANSQGWNTPTSPRSSGEVGLSGTRTPSAAGSPPSPVAILSSTALNSMAAAIDRLVDSAGTGPSGGGDCDGFSDASLGTSASGGSMRMSKSGQRNRIVAYLHRQTACAVGLVRRLRVAKRSASAGGEDSSGSSSGGSARNSADFQSEGSYMREGSNNSILAE